MTQQNNFMRDNNHKFSTGSKFGLDSNYHQSNTVRAPAGIPLPERITNQGDHMLNVKLLTLKEAEACLKLSTWGLYQLINNNIIPTVRIGNRRFIRLSTLLDYITNLEKQSQNGGNYA